MCGIVYFESKQNKNATKPTLKRYRNQKSRGSEGFGYVALNGNKVQGIRRRTREKDIVEQLEKSKNTALLFHHRYPTSTINLKETAHPITVENARLKNKYYIIHNGVITNSEDLKKQHNALGYEYKTEVKQIKKWKTTDNMYTSETSCFNDSEALSIEIAEVLEGKKATIEAKGSIAFIALQVHEGKALKMFYGRNEGNPLVIEDTKQFFSLKSQGEGKRIKSDILYTYNMETKETTEEQMEIGSYTIYNKRPIGYTSYNSDSGNNYGYDYGSEINEPPYQLPDTVRELESELMTIHFDGSDMLKEGYTPEEIVEMYEDDICQVQEYLVYATKAEEQEVKNLIQELERTQQSFIYLAEGQSSFMEKSIEEARQDYLYQ